MSEFWDRAEKSRFRGDIRDGDTRYVMVRTDVIADLFAGLEDDTKREVLDAFARSVHDNGGKSLSRYLQMAGGDTAALLDTACRTAGDLGWGVWTIERSTDTLDLDVRNSPFCAIDGLADEPVCAPIRGMFTALAETVLGGEVQAAETQCAGCGSPACTFHAVRGGN